ncbi:hypothetical protein P168DRAFT_297975 [Aspergillus campestris IBT 28561]|uniref:glycerol kinase n=1 Tax=Aspergillus campestris (strain IBT 28561) TaxID=1392248 RepID=A0A2I1CZP8_ASPC2|nr:uncharacterized protein P168DRAFT_297975 [Aspergillus campestris IBT 28561]PKY03094.1 hypothetical protein P168DRAFT_297975 [Aspergillus campestris IBT 28561]
MEDFVGVVDQGTTSTRFIIFNCKGEPVACHQVEFPQLYPHPGWHSHNPLDIISSVESCIDQAVHKFESAGHTRTNIRAIGIANQRETTLVWDRITGEPLADAIVWTDTRSQSLITELKQKHTPEQLATVQHICGLPLSTYSSASKLLWLLANEPRVRDASERGTLVIGTVDTWLVYKLNGGPVADVFVTDATNASRTMFMNLDTLEYDPFLLDLFGLSTSSTNTTTTTNHTIHLPKISSSSHPTAYGTLTTTTLAGTPITSCLGDQSAALIGQRGLSAGKAKNTYGTGCFLLYNVGEKAVRSTHGLLATVAYHFKGCNPVYALEGSIAVAGSGVAFLRENMGFGDTASDIDRLAESVPDSGGVVFVTAFSGLFATYWVGGARGCIFGLTQHTQKGHIARATLEATCFQTKAILQAMEKDSGHTLTELAVDGGMSNSDTQADLISIPVRRPQMRETTALGAAVAATRACGLVETVFEPRVGREESEALFGRWERAVELCAGWVVNDSSS